MSMKLYDLFMKWDGLNVKVMLNTPNEYKVLSHFICGENSVNKFVKEVSNRLSKFDEIYEVSTFTVKDNCLIIYVYEK